VAGGSTTGPSTWDGYAATVVSGTALRALTEGERVEVSQREQPELYR
jgi:myo-inositol 2-dehydrogenase/D-chiro-inositol 1-dehydrogenase